jgi:Uma2 family endonuclease
MQHVPYALDPDDPRAPSTDEWAAMSAEERAAVVASLPSEYPRATPPEGDLHRRPKERALQTLSDFFERTRRRIYLSAELPVYYPAQPMFAPDLIAVRDVEPGDRMGWVVSKEGKGIDFALELHVAGSAKKDFEDNVTRFAELGIPEYFAYDVNRQRLLGFRLPAPAASRYEPIVPQAGRWFSTVLELDLSIDAGQLRFLHGSAPLLEARELIAQLSSIVDGAVRRAEAEAKRAEDQTKRAEDEAKRAEDEAKRADRLAAKLRELGVDPGELK